MNEVRPLHHVFSSDGGYRTLYASQDLGEGAVRALEAFASASQRAYSHGQSYACLSLVDGPVVLSCTFVHGADHVGRRRLCTHSMVLPPETRQVDGFHPAVPQTEHFMTKEVPAERPGHFLSAAISFPDRAAVTSAQEQAFLELDDKNADLLTSLLSPARTVVIAGSSSDGIGRLASVGWLLPPEMRTDLRYRSGFWPPEELDTFGPVSAVLLQQAAQLDSYPEGEFVHASLYDEEGEDAELTLAEGWGHPYVEFLLELHSDTAGPQRLRSFLDTLRDHPGPAQPSFDQQSCLVSGYRAAEGALREFAASGQFVTQTPELISSLSLLARSGRIPLAEALLAQLRTSSAAMERPILKRSITALQRLLQEGFFLQGLELGRDLVEYGKELRRAATVRQEQP